MSENKRESFFNEDTKKRMYTLSVIAISVVIQTLIILVVWLGYYNNKPIIRKIFVLRGHYFIMVLYAIVLFAFNRSCGSMKIGYYKMPDIMFSQMVANIASNVVLYLEICLLAYGFPSPDRKSTRLNSSH